MRRTKIIATIGPATDSTEALSSLVAAGMDVARLNSSHAGVESLHARLTAVRSAARAAGKPVAVMLDLAGPKLRVGEVAHGTELSCGSRFDLVPGVCVGDASRACVTYSALAEDLAPGDRIMLDDGRLELAVTALEHGSVLTRVEVGGPLTSHKGVNVPGVTLGVDPITEFDREVLAWGIAAGVDYVAQSFVRSAADVTTLRGLLGDSGIPIIAKIEKHEAAENVEEIIDVADAVMVARGDLGVETSPERVPVLQRHIVAACRATGTPVIVATQMLESMTVAPRPTRAEASDVATAVFDGADALMLSAETAVGIYPCDAVETMVRIICTAEESIRSEVHRHGAEEVCGVTEAVSAAVCDLAEDLEAAAIVTATQSGATARSVARHRPGIPIIAVTPFDVVARQLSLVWGVRPLIVPLEDQTDRMLDAVEDAVRGAGFAVPGQRIAITAGISSRSSGATDFILVREMSPQAV